MNDAINGKERKSFMREILNYRLNPHNSVYVYDTVINERSSAPQKTGPEYIPHWHYDRMLAKHLSECLTLQEYYSNYTVTMVYPIKSPLAIIPSLHYFRRNDINVHTTHLRVISESDLELHMSARETKKI